MIRQEITNLIQKAIGKAQKDKKLPPFNVPMISIEKPEEETHGDYSSSISFKIGKITKKGPIEIANLLNSEFRIQNLEFLDKVEVVEPGFINFFLSKEYLQKELKKILKEEERFGQLNFGKNEKVNIEFISANPTGSLHIGNGRGAFFGDCLANVFKKAGYKVVREYYINNAKVSTQIRTLGKTALGKGVTYLNPYLESKILQIKDKLKSIKDEGEAGHLLAQEVQKDNKNLIEKKLKIKFNNWFFEDSLYKKNKITRAYNWLKKEKLVYQKDGAQWLKVSKFGASKDEVIIRQTNEPTYFLSDIAYHQDKFSRNFKRIINIWGADHQGHVPKIKAISKILGYKGTVDILISQIVRLKKGKISKRKGEIITLESLIDEVGLDAARFFYLMKSLNTQMEFDIELAKERSAKSPVYYVQYAHARICSILGKATNHKLQATNYRLLTHLSELNLIKQLIRFSEIVEDTARDYQVQRIPQYSIDLATSFHQFYRDCHVLPASYRTEGSDRGAKDKLLSEARLGLISAVKIVLKSALSLMGISSPEKM